MRETELFINGKRDSVNFKPMRVWVSGFCLVLFLLSGCAGSGGARSQSPESSGSQSGSADVGVTNPGVNPGTPPEPTPLTFTQPVAISVSPETFTFKPPVAISVSPDTFTFKPPVAISDEDLFTTNPCMEIFRVYVTDPSTSLDPCNRARIPGLTPLYERVSAMISAQIQAGETITKIGVILDGDDINSPGSMHGTDVSNTAAIAAPRELFDYVNVPIGDLCRSAGFMVVCTVDVTNAFRELDESIYSMGPIINMSQRELFSTLANSRINVIVRANFINVGDVRNKNALLVVSAGNEGTFNPSHDFDALTEIHQETGSILIVAGLGDSNLGFTLPIINQNGFHRGYTNGNPVIHGSSDRCGFAMEYCVAAPYTIYTSATQRGGGIEVGGISGTSFSAPLVSGTLMSLRYVWDHLTNQQLVRLACVTAEDLGADGIDAIYGCGQFSVSDIWLPTGRLVSDPIAEFSLGVAEGAMQLSGASFSETVTVTGYENNEFARDYKVAVPASSSPTSLRIEPTISWSSVNTMMKFRNNGSLSLPVANGRGSAAHLFKDTFLFFKEANRGSALGLSHASGLSIAFERETDSFFGSIGSGSYEFGDTNKFVASFDRQFNLNETYGVGVKLAAAYGEMEPDISLIKSAKGTAQTAQVAFVRKRNNFESRLEMNYNTGLKGTVSIQNTDYRLKPRSETAIMLKMRFAL